MNEKIEIKPPGRTSEFSPEFTSGLIMATCAILLVVFLPKASGLYGGRNFRNIMAPAHIIAAGITVEHAIDEFQGIELTPLGGKTKVILLFAILLDFVIVPACFLFCWRYLFMKKSQVGDSAGGRSRQLGGRFIFILSGVAIAYVCIIHTGLALTSSAVLRTMRLDNTLDQNRSFVVAGLAAIDFKANQYFYLPGKRGGGDHSFRSHQDPTGKNWVTLSELGMPAETEVGRYSIKTVKNDTILIMRGVGKVRRVNGTNPEYEYYTSPTISRILKIN